MQKYNNMINITNIEYVQLIKNPEVIRLSEGSFVIPLPYVRYKYIPELTTFKDFTRMIEWDLMKFINFMIIYLRKPKYTTFEDSDNFNNKAEEFTDKDVYLFVLDGFKRRFISSDNPTKEELDFLKEIFDKRIKHYNRVGYYVFEAWVKKTYPDVFVGKKAQLHCVKKGTTSRYERSGMAHSMHKECKINMLFDMFIRMGKRSVNRYIKSFKVASDRKAFGENKCHFRNHEELIKRANNLFVKYGFKEVKRSQFMVYLKEMLDGLCMTLAQFLKILRSGWLNVDNRFVEQLYDTLFTARIPKGKDTRYKLIDRHLNKFLKDVNEDVGWDCCDFSDNYINVNANYYFV